MALEHDMRSTMVTDADGKINRDYDGVAMRADPKEHLGLAHKMAWWCARRNASAQGRRCDEDEQLHWLGWCVEMLYRCQRSFDLTRGFRFSTYYCRSVMIEYRKRDEDHNRLVKRVDASGTQRWAGRRMPTITEVRAPLDQEYADMQGGCRWSRMMVARGEDALRPDEIVEQREELARMHVRLEAHLSHDLELAEWEMVRRSAAGENYASIGRDRGVSRSAISERMRETLGGAATSALAATKGFGGRPRRPIAV